MCFFVKINYVKVHVIPYGVTATTSAASVAAASGASCRGCQVTLLDFVAITADDDRIYFLVAHRVIAGDPFFEACHEENGVDLRRNLFRCDRQVSLTFILYIFHI